MSKARIPSEERLVPALKRRNATRPEDQRVDIRKFVTLAKSTKGTAQKRLTSQGILNAAEAVGLQSEGEQILNDACGLVTAAATEDPTEGDANSPDDDTERRKRDEARRRSEEASFGNVPVDGEKDEQPDGTEPVGGGVDEIRHAQLDEPD